MPNLNHRFSSGRMNKDLDERLVPNGEYRDALNIEVATSDTSDMGTVQTVMGNLNMSLITIDPNNTGEFYCVGSVVNEQHDKIYWMLAGRTSDIIAEYDYKTQTTTPVVVDLFSAGTIPGNESGRVLNFDRAFTITGINIIENMLFWTDNYSEPKRIHIDRCKLGTPDFTSQTQLYVRDISTNNASIDYYPKGDLTHEHITVIKKSPPAPPVLEMRNKLRTEQGTQTNYAPEISINVYGNFTTNPGNPFFDSNSDPIQNLSINFNIIGGIYNINAFPDFVIGDIINIYSGFDGTDNYSEYVRAEITSYDVSTGSATLKVLSGTKTIVSNVGEWYVELEQAEPLFQFKFPRFGIRYKYEDGEYSSFSPFSQVAFLPQRFDYLPKEGYNLGMVNNLRFLAIRDFVHGQSIPDDVISVDILYKESNSPNIYTIKTIKRLENDWVPGFEPWSNNITSLDDVTANYSEWNAIGPKDTVGAANGLVPGQLTRGWTRITSEMIHAILPANQLLRPYDNVPRVALAQEVVGNRLVYGNYLQNYNMFNRFAINSKALQYYSEYNFGELDPQSQITVDIKTSITSKQINGNLLPQQSNPFANDAYSPSKSIKTLRTYQLGVVYIDEYGRETPVFSNSTTDKSSLYVEKVVANQKNSLEAQLYNTHPEWAKSYKFFVKETSSEYYNLAMDRWYDADDGNIWISFPSSERNKLDLETFLILKKEHDNDTFVSSPARYKCIAIENEAPLFIKTSKIQQPLLLETKNAAPFDLGGPGGGGFPTVGLSQFIFDKTAIQSAGWENILQLDPTLSTSSTPVFLKDFDVRFTGTAVTGDDFSSDWYRLQGFEDLGSDYRFKIFKKFDSDINVLSTDGTIATYTGGAKIELRQRIVENKPEFDGRFFVKIKRDSILEDTIIKPVRTTGWQVANAMYVQYINPYSTWSISDAPRVAGDGFFGYYNAALPPNGEEVISISEEQGRCTTDVNFTEGEGQNYWSLASHNLTGAGESSGWFIDRVEGFRRFKTTEHYYGVTNVDAWNTVNQTDITRTYRHNFSSQDVQWEDYAPYYNWWGSPGNYTNGNNRYRMPVVMGTATTPSAGTREYLNLYHGGEADPFFSDASLNKPASVNGPAYLGPTRNGIDDYWINPSGLNNSYPDFNSFAIANNINTVADYVNQTVLRTGLNGYLQDEDDWGSLRNNGGTIIPSLGIDGHPNANSSSPHLGTVCNIPGNYQGTNIITLSHSGVGSDLEDVNAAYGDNAPSLDSGAPTLEGLMLHFDFIGSAGVSAPITKHVADIDFINRLLQPGTTWRWAEDPDQIIYKTVSPDISNLSVWGITANELNSNFGSDPLDFKPGVGLYNYCRLGDYVDSFKQKDDDFSFYVSGGVNSIDTWDQIYYASGGNGTMGQKHWKYSASKTTGADSIGPGVYSDREIFHDMLGAANTCGGWSYYSNFDSGNFVDGITSEPHNMWPMYVKDWWKAINRRRRYMFVAETYEGGLGLGEQGSKYLPTNDPTLEPHFDSTGALKTGVALPSTPAPGIRADGVYSGYNNVPYGATTDANGYVGGGVAPNPPGSVTWQIIEPYINDESEKYSSKNPAIWETEPKETVDLNIYYEVGQIYPIELNEKTGEQFVGPIHPSIPLAILNSKVTCYDPNPTTNPSGIFRPIRTATGPALNAQLDIRVESLQDNVLTLCDVDGTPLNINTSPTGIFPQTGDRLIFTRSNGGKTETTILSFNITTGEIQLDRDLHNYKVTLPWHNCYSFGNGVESDRIRDDFNQVTIDNGPKASATLEEPYEEERRGSGLIYSGIYNSMSGINNLNQFIQAEKITKDLNPSYGTIQKLYARNTNLVTLCEDKVFKILANKDALFNADGNSNVTATDRVLGQTIPYAGDFGISKNPESFVNESFRSYFTDKVRGQVLRLSQDGITPISDFGMSDWFSDNLKLANRLIGSYDEKKDEYNLTLDHNDYPLAQPVHVIDNFIVEIESENCGCGGNYDVPTGRIITSIQQSVAVGMVLNGPGLAGNTVVTAVTPNFSQLILTVNPEPAFADVVSLFGPNPSAWQTHVSLGTQPDPVSTYTNTSGNYDLTVSFSERSKGWTSFKSWAQENGVSLNNTYYTFKGGHLHEHHVESQPRNNFYGDQYDSSIEVLFNEAPELVKSFNTLNYEGTQSRVTPDIENSGEYWDNYLHTGWYVSNMLTNLQEGSMQEFREKEGKWFSQIKGVTTEWLDDGKAGNIDTREFSYQGIDEADDIEIISGGYTSYDCAPLQSTSECDDRFLTPTGNWTNNYQDHYWWFDNQTKKRSRHKFIVGSSTPLELLPAFDTNPPLLWGNVAVSNAFIQGIKGMVHSNTAPASTPNLSYVDPNDPSQGYYQKYKKFELFYGQNYPPNYMGGNPPQSATGMWQGDTIQEMIIWCRDIHKPDLCSDPGLTQYQIDRCNDPLGDFYVGMSYDEWFFAFANLPGFQDVSTYRMFYDNSTCLTSPVPNAPLTCIERQGKVGEPGAGQYATLSACEAVCGLNEETYECINGQCVDPGDGSGSYSTYCECVNDSLCCDEGLAYAYTCQNIAEPTPVIYGCMDDGVTTDLYTTRFRPPNWVGAASNYYPAANTPDCSCEYNAPPVAVTVNCSGATGATLTLPDGTVQNIPAYTCYDPLDGTGQYTQSSAVASGYADPFAQCNDNCRPQTFSGCTDPTALNYDPLATIDDGSCLYPDPYITGCELDPNNQISYDAGFQQAYNGDYQFATNGYAGNVAWSPNAPPINWNGSIQEALDNHGFVLQNSTNIISDPGYGQWHWFTGSNGNPNPTNDIPIPTVGSDGLTLELGTNIYTSTNPGTFGLTQNVQHVVGVYMAYPSWMLSYAPGFYVEITFGPNSTLTNDNAGIVFGGGVKNPQLKIGANVFNIVQGGVTYTGQPGLNLNLSGTLGNNFVPPNNYKVGTPPTIQNIIVNPASSNISSLRTYFTISLRGKNGGKLNIKSICFIPIPVG